MKDTQKMRELIKMKPRELQLEAEKFFELSYPELVDAVNQIEAIKLNAMITFIAGHDYSKKLKVVK